MTKRKNSRIDPNDRLHHTRGRFHGAPNSEFHISIRADTDPKTSEYAFFKKLKKDAGLRFRSHSLQKDACLSRKPESSDYSRERTHDDVRVGSKGFNSSRIIEDVPTVKTDSFLSPSGGALNNSDSISSMRKNLQECGDTLEPQGIFSREGNQYVHGEIFARKRQKLRQCVADALFPDIEKLCSKGHDIVSMLLGRLFPMSIEENKYEDPNPGKVVNATRYDLLDSRESDVQFKEHHQIPKRTLLELESSSCFSDHSLSPLFLRSAEIITPHADFATYHSHKFQPLYSITEPECEFGGTPSFSAKSDVILGFPFNEVLNATRYGLLDSRELDVQFKEHHMIPKRKLLELESSSYFSDRLLSPMFLRSDETITPHPVFPTSPHKFQPLYSVTEPESEVGGTPTFSDKSDVTLGFLCNEQKHETFTLSHFKELGKLEREPTPLLLEKDFDCTTDDINLPITCTYGKPDIAPVLSTLGNDEEQILNSTLDEYHFSPSSLLHDKPQDFNSMLDSGLLRYQQFGFGKYVYEDEEDMGTNFNHTAFSLLDNKHYFKLLEDCKNDTSCVQDSICLSPYQHWIRRTVSNDYHHHPDTEAWLSSSLDFISGRRCFSLISSHSDYQSSNSSTLRLPQRESMSSIFHSNDNLDRFRENLIEICNTSFLHISMKGDNGCQLPQDGSDYISKQEQSHKMLL